MNVAAEFQEIAVLVNHDRFESPLVQMPDAAMAAVKYGGVADIKMAHELGEIGLGRGHQQMKVVGHEHVGVKLDLVIGQRSTQLLQEDRSVAVVAVDRPPVVAAAGDMVKSAGNQYAQGPGHWLLLSSAWGLTQ